jgi:hypothetical protein
LFKKRSDHGIVVLICSHGGLYRPVKKKVADKGRNSSTIKTNCQFRITDQKLSNGQWKIKEDEAEYKRAVKCFHECFGVYPKVFVTDKEDALRNALQKEFPLAANLLCNWLINKNILKNALNQFECRDSFDCFMKDWSLVLSSRNADDFHDSLDQLREKYIPNKGAFDPRINAYTYNICVYAKT